MVIVQALGPVMNARIQVEIQSSDHLSLATAVELSYSESGLEASSKQLQRSAPNHQQQQQTCHQKHQQQLLGQQQLQALSELHAPAAPVPGINDFLSDFGNLSPARSSQLFGSLDFLHDLGLPPGEAASSPHPARHPLDDSRLNNNHISHA